MNPKYLNIIGLAYRARKCTLGEDLILKDIQTNKAKLVLIAKDIGQQTRKKITNKCKYYQVSLIEADDRKTLAEALGKSQTVALAITDQGFAEKLKAMLG